MKQEFIDAIENGEIVKHQAFLTERGGYQIALIRYNDNIYFFKYRNGNIVECTNLSKKKGKNVEEAIKRRKANDHSRGV